MSGSAFDQAEISDYASRKTRLYRVVRGDVAWHYTAGDVQVVWSGATWLSTPISDSGIKQRGSSSADDFTVTVPSTLPVVQMFRGSPPSEPVRLFVREVMPDNPGIAPLVWSGWIASVRYKDDATSMLICNTHTALLGQQGLRLTWGRACPHALYGPDCGLDKTNWGQAVVITELSGNGFRFVYEAPSPLWPFAFTGGFVEWQTPDGYYERRAIQVDNNDQTCVIIGVTLGMTVGMEAVLYPGCQRTAINCALFKNTSAHGGFDFLPGKSPFNGNRIF